MSEQTMVERVGRALAEADDADYAAHAADYDRRARAAIVAMQKLTRPMKLAGRAADADRRYSSYMWTVMIDAALAEQA